jgi:hypothetical protein
MVAAFNSAETIWTEDWVEDQPQPYSSGSSLQMLVHRLINFVTILCVLKS